MKKKFCSVPFNSVHLVPGGDVYVCGWSDEKIGNVLKEDIEKIWGGEKAEKIRKSIIEDSYQYCRAVSCPYLENDSLPYLTEEEMQREAVKSSCPTKYSVACDFTCNHSCPSCRDKIFVGDADYKEKLQKITDRLLPYLNAADEVVTCGNGDVFSSPQMLSMVERLRPEKDCFTLYIETNGVLFDEEHWKKMEHLAGYNVKVVVTPNSFEPKTFKYLNGGHDTYDRLIENLYFIRELRKKELVNFYEISIVVQDRNFLELPGFAERCLKDFEVDRVVVKPLYRWFCLPEDMYWHKDVLNPRHPYHQEYLEMLKAPILNEERVYFWGGRNLHEPELHPAYRYREYLELIQKLFATENLPNAIRAFFEKLEAASVYIYGDTLMSSIVCNILEKGICISAFIARDTDKDTICGRKVIRMEEYQSEMGDVVLVLNYHFFKNIKRDLDFGGFKGQLVRLDEFVNAL